MHSFRKCSMFFYNKLLNIYVFVVYICLFVSFFFVFVRLLTHVYQTQLGTSVSIFSLFASTVFIYFLVAHGSQHTSFLIQNTDFLSNRNILMEIIILNTQMQDMRGLGEGGGAACSGSDILGRNFNSPPNAEVYGPANWYYMFDSRKISVFLFLLWFFYFFSLVS